MRRSIGAQGTLSEGVDLYIPNFSSRNLTAVVVRSAGDGLPALMRQTKSEVITMLVKLRKKSLRETAQRLINKEINYVGVKNSDIDEKMAILRQKISQLRKHL